MELTPEALQAEYIERDLTLSQVADMFGVSQATVLKYRRLWRLQAKKRGKRAIADPSARLGAKGENL